MLKIPGVTVQNIVAWATRHPGGHMHCYQRTTSEKSIRVTVDIKDAKQHIKTGRRLNRATKAG